MTELTAEDTESAERRSKDELLSRSIIGAAIAVHKSLGPGLLESAYEACLAAEFRHQGLSFNRQVPVMVRYRGEVVDCAYRLDFLVEDRVIVEIKSVDKLGPVHQAQLLSYLRLTTKCLGLLINFNVPKLIDGVQRLVHEYHAS